MATADPFAASQAFVLLVEGGFSNNSRDPGGMTNLGVTKHAWEKWVGHAVSEAVMRSLTPALVAPFYKASYWRPINGDKLPPAVALLVYQAAVNEGVKRAAEFLQVEVGADADGDIGTLTCVALRNKIASIGLKAILSAYCDSQRDYYRSLATFATFGDGWLNRIDLAYAAALKLV